MTNKNITHQEEQKDLLNHFLEVHCFNAWRIKPSIRDTMKEKPYVNSIEMMVSPVCNTACSYCYMKNYSKKLYSCGYEKDILLKNCEKTMKWLVKNDFYPESIEIFSGEFFNLPYWKDYLNIILDNLKKMPEGYNIDVIIPTNATFIFSKEKTQEIQKIINQWEEEGYGLWLSISVDGKYLDNDTRPLKNGKKYDDNFYDRLFKFCAKNNLGFHPMIGAKGIDKWEDNFDWYVENIQKYFNLPKKEALRRIYLLEVRNPDWKTEELKKLQKFLNHIIDVILEGEEHSSPEEKFKYIKTYSLNILSSLHCTVGRGLGCSFQQCFDLRMGDLALVQCHRTAYRELLGGYCKFSDEGDLTLEPLNVNSYILSNSFDFKHAAKCQDCPINMFCAGPCIGCNYEVNKDLYTMVPTVCDLEYVKYSTLVERMEKEGILNIIIRDLEYAEYGDIARRKIQLENFKEYLKIKEIQEEIK